jgi:hypothetical protein
MTVDRLPLLEALERYVDGRPPGLRYAALPQMGCPRADNLGYDHRWPDVARERGLCGAWARQADTAVIVLCLDPSGHPGGHGWAERLEATDGFVMSIDPLARIRRRALAGARMPSA